MLRQSPSLDLDSADLHDRLEEAADLDLDTLSFGIIGFDAEGRVRRYNAAESRLAGLSQERVLGHSLFEVVAPCMNNAMVAQRFADASDGATMLDTTFDYVFTLKMRPERVRLRLLASPRHAVRYVVVARAVHA